MSLEINDFIIFLSTHPQRPALRCKSFNKSQDEAKLSANEGKISQLLKTLGIHESVFGSVGVNAGVCVCDALCSIISLLYFIPNTAGRTYIEGCSQCIQLTYATFQSIADPKYL